MDTCVTSSKVTTEYKSRGDLLNMEPVRTNSDQPENATLDAEKLVSPSACKASGINGQQGVVKLHLFGRSFAVGPFVQGNSQRLFGSEYWALCIIQKRVEFLADRNRQRRTGTNPQHCFQNWNCPGIENQLIWQ